MHIGSVLDMRGNIISHVFKYRIFIYYIYTFNLVSLFVNEKPLWGVTNKAFICSLRKQPSFFAPGRSGCV